MYWAQSIFGCYWCKHFKIFHWIFKAACIPKLHLWWRKIDVKSKPTLVMAVHGIAYYSILFLGLQFELFHWLGEIVKSIKIISKSINDLWWLKRMGFKIPVSEQQQKIYKQVKQARRAHMDTLFITSVLQNRKLIPKCFLTYWMKYIFVDVFCILIHSTITKSIEII